MGNLEIREFQQAIVNYTNASLIPIEVKRLVLSDILSQLSSAAGDAIQSELVERTKKEEAEKNGTEQTVHED